MYKDKYTCTKPKKKACTQKRKGALSKYMCMKRIQYFIGTQNTYVHKTFKKAQTPIQTKPYVFTYTPGLGVDP